MLLYSLMRRQFRTVNWLICGILIGCLGCTVGSSPLATLPLEHPGATQANLAGIDFYQEGKWEQALTQFQEALKIDPTFPEAHFNMALTLHQLKRHEEAAQHFKRAGELSPDNQAIIDSSLYRNHLGLSSTFERHLSGGYGYSGGE